MRTTTELKSWNDELMARSMLEPAPRASNSARHGFGLPGCGERQVDAIDGFAEEFTALSVPYSPLAEAGDVTGKRGFVDFVIPKLLNERERGCNTGLRSAVGLHQIGACPRRSR